MTLVTRAGKGSELTWPELDNNFTHCLSRGNHTGTQLAETISDFGSATRAQVEAELVAGSNITITPSGAGATRQLTIASTGGGGAVDSVNGQTGVVVLDTDDISEGAANLYFTEGRVRSTVLTGLSLLTGGVISAADSVLSALGKIQKQISDAVTAIGSKQDTLVSGTNLKTVNGNSLLGSGNMVVTGAAVNQCIPIACSDETTALTTGTANVTFRMPYAFTLSEVRASLTTAQISGSVLTVDINENGTSVLSTKLTIDNTKKTSVTAATPAVISDASLANDAEITIDIDLIGDGTAKGLKVYLIGVPA